MGCQDAVSIGLENRSAFAIEALEESIRLGGGSDHYNELSVGATEQVLTDSPEWETIELRVRRVGSEATGELMLTERSEATALDDDSFDFVISIDPAVCAQLP